MKTIVIKDKHNNTYVIPYNLKDSTEYTLLSKTYYSISNIKM